MKKNIFILLFAVLFFVPISVKADTWLDKEEYRDISWFDASTYDETNEYTLDSAQKVAGLLYLVNVDGYKFDDKIINIEGNYKAFFCSYDQKCSIDMREHDWIPLSENFNGIFKNNSYYSYYIYLFFNYYEGFKLVNKDKIRYCSNSSCTSESNTSDNTLIHMYLPIYKEINNGDIIFESPYYLPRIFQFSIVPDDGYYLDDIEVTDSDGNKIKYTYMGDNSFQFYMTERSSITIKAIIKEKNNDKCIVIKGTGKELGDEIACGEEHFYVLENDNNNIRMLSKYNLYTGISIYKEKIEKEAGDTRTDSQYCSDLAISRGGAVKSDDFYNAPGYCFYTKFLPYYKIVQTEDSKSAHWDEDLNYLYPQVGDVYMHNGYNYGPSPVSDATKIGNTRFYDYVIKPEKALTYLNEYEYLQKQGRVGILLPLYIYKNRLINNGINVSDISLISLTELNNLASSLSGNSLPLEEWSSHAYSDTISNHLYNFGDLKSYIPEKYKWLYSTTYWNRSYFHRGDNGSSPSVNYATDGRLFIFTAEQGKVCGAGYVGCAPETTLGCGIRPVITIPANDVTYKINTKTDGNGTIEVVNNSAGGETILFRLNGKKGFSLNKLIITTDSGETVEFTEGDLIKNDDGTITIKNNKFTMPFESVTIKVSWKAENSSLINPPTGDSIKIYVLTLITTFGLETFLYIYVKKKYLNKKEF